MTDATDSSDLAALAAEAYVYGYPLVHNLTMVDRITRRGTGSVAPAEFNEFVHFSRLAGPDDDFVSVGNDTLYSTAQLDLSGGPLLLHVPDYGGEYYVLQFVDAWSNNFAYLGSRATGTAECRWLITPPGWSGSAPEGVRIVDAPTAVVSVVGRSACAGPDDVPRVAALQRELTLTPALPRTLGFSPELSASPPSSRLPRALGSARAGGTPMSRGGSHGQGGPPWAGGTSMGRGAGLPTPDPAVPEQLRFFEELRVWMADFPPPPPDSAYQDRFQPLGLLEEGPSPYAGADPALVRALEAGLAAGRERVEIASEPPPHESPAGAWEMDLHLFDYNLDRLGPGTLDEARWKIADRRESYLVRAATALTALWGCHAYEAVQACTFTDAEGKQLNGAHSYTLRFEEPPPVDAFWSLTMYDTPDHFLVDNPAGRYSIGDRTPGLVRADDGSLTLVLQHERPKDPVEAANWLPAPAGDFRPMIRLYQPREPVLRGDYRLPRVVRR
ncbi:DUF1254 domain-containing protein [Streptomyces sannanensis]|uniref:DUF1254 domain-containing protein n=1 Tax=Streptomyces sannanensis TaxID=285536 RepID=A0ABP6SCV3_9ACTN